MGSGGSRTRSVCAAAPTAERGRFDGRADDLGELRPGAAQLQPSARDARDVEKVVDQAGQLLQLPLDDRRGLLAALGGELRHRHQLHGVGHGGERIAQLVRQGGEEHVLAVVRLAQRFFRPVPVAHVDHGRNAADHVALLVELGLVGEAHVLRAEGFVRHRELHVDAAAGQCLGQVRVDGPVGVGAEHVGDRAADQLARVEAEARGVRLVDELEPVRAIAMRDQHRGAVGDEPQLPLTGARVFLCLQPRRDVPVDLEHDAFAARGIERPARIDSDDAAVAAAVHEAPFPGAVALQGFLDGHQRPGEAGLEQAV